MGYCILISVPIITIEDFFRERVKNKEFFGGEAIIFMKFIRGRPIFIKGWSHILRKFSGMNAILFYLIFRGKKKRQVLNRERGDGY